MGFAFKMYTIEYSMQALTDIGWFRKHEQSEVFDNVDQQLQFEPLIETRNRKRLKPNATAEWELRIGKFRVFYDVDTVVQIVAIERVAEKRGSLLFFRGKREDV